MDLQPVLFPAMTNRESWRSTLQLNDEDTGDLLDLTGMTFQMEVRLACDVPSPGSGYVPFYDYGTTDDFGAVLTASLGDGITVVSTGVLQWFFPETSMRSLCPGTYNVALTMSDGTDTRQIFLGRLPVLFGGVSN